MLLIKIQGSCWWCPLLPAHTQQHREHPLTACLMPNPTLHWSSHTYFYWLQSKADHSAGDNCIPTTLWLKKSFLRLLHFMGGNIIQHPLSLAWSHFKSCAGYSTNEMHKGCTRWDVLHLFWAEVRTNLEILCRLITGSVYLFVCPMTWLVPWFLVWVEELICSCATGFSAFTKIIGSETPLVQRARGGSGAQYGLNSWKQYCNIM